MGLIQVLGVAHYHVEFAEAVRSTVEDLDPAAIAVELPSTLEEAVRRGVRRLPELSVVVYGTGSDETVYLPVEPCDPIVEAVRCGLEREIPVAFVDLDVDEYPSYRDILPDPYAVTRLGAEVYAETCRELLPATSEIVDQRREEGMAARTVRLAEQVEGTVLLVCGLAHLRGVREALLRRNHAEPLARVRREGVTLFNLDPECLPEVLGEYPFVNAVYERRRPEPPPDPGPEVLCSRRQVGPFQVIEGRRRDEEEEIRRAVDRTCRRAGSDDPLHGPLDRIRVNAALFDEALARWTALTGEEVRPWQRRAFARFSRRLARSNRQLVPDLHDLVVASRGCVDENFAYETWRIASTYPWQKGVSDVPTVRIRGEDLMLGTRRLRLRPRIPRPGRRGSPNLRRRRGERYPGEWIDSFSGEGICSYPPEDIAVEDLGRYLRRRGKSLLAEEDSRSERFVVSLKDGIDVRETIRNWHEGEIFVREECRTPGEVGSVVVIFDDDRDEARYPFRLTWLGEHDEESDMAFYATDPARGIVGPGICRAEYGGFLLSYPPRRMLDIWTDPDYAMAETRPERLILAALDYSVLPLIVVVAERAPGSRVREWATRLDRRIVYLPLGQLSPATLKKLRVLHILDGQSRREIARDYVW